jgi:AcrR family transcriptional regulator
VEGSAHEMRWQSGQTDPLPVPEPWPQSWWDVAEDPPPNRRGELNPYDIKMAALAIVDADGLGSLTMRNLASKLGVAPMALYRHAKSKEVVIGLLVNQVHAEMILRDITSKSWRTVMRESAFLSRQVMLRHRWLPDLPASLVYASTPDGRSAVEQMLASLKGNGLTVDTMMDIAVSVGSYSRAMAFAEIAEARSHEIELPGLGASPMSHFPILEEYMYSGSSTGDADKRFEFGLECLLEGISSRLGI